MIPAPVHFSRTSTNAKTGPIAVSTSARATCPTTCKLRNNGCYAENFPLSLHWDAVSSGRRGVPFEEFLLLVRALPKGSLWRHNQAGDLEHTAGTIDRKALKALAAASVGRRGFTYTHHSMKIAANRRAVAFANASGFTVNLSADNLVQADEYVKLGVAPVVVVVPPGWHGETPAGNKITRCPAQFMPDMTCAVCGLCAKADRKGIVSFEAHGGRKGAVMKTFQMRLEI